MAAILRLFRGSIRESKPTSLPPPSIKLPIELWQQVVSYLDLLSTTSLALSCRSMRRIIGTRIFQTLSKSPDKATKLRFLALLASDLPGHWLCETCCEWHALRSRRFSGKLEYTDLDCRRRSAIRVYVLDNYTSIDIFRAMSALRYQKFGPKFGSPIGLRVWDPAREYWCSILSKVVHGSLLVKTEVRRTLPPDAHHYFRSVCHHLDGQLFGHAAALSKLKMQVDAMSKDEAIVDAITMLAAEFCRFSSENVSCTECPSEYRVHVQRPHASESCTWTYTRWIDLGRCEHTRDEHFRTLVGNLQLDDLLPFDYEKYRRLNPTSIRERYEQGTEDDVGSHKAKIILPFRAQWSNDDETFCVVLSDPVRS